MARSKEEKALDRLYSAPLDEFIATRDELAAHLTEPRKLKKPTVPAWAVNQAVRRAPRKAAELTKAGAALRTAQEGLAADGGRDRFRKAQSRVRAATRDLRAEAGAALEEAGRDVSASVGDQIDQTLQAAALDPAVGEQVTSGRLERPDTAVGFPGVAPARDPKASRAREKERKKLARERERLAEATGRREAAEAALEEAERAAEAANRERDKAQNKLDAEAKREREAADRVDALDSG